MKFTALVCSLLLAQCVMAATSSLYEIPLKDINDKSTSLNAYQGKVIMVVNVASRCGLTPQYDALEAVHKKYQDKGLAVLGFPCNDFGAQEPGTAEEIKTFCSTKYNVTFPLFAKLHVKGEEQHPLYKALTGKDSPFPGDVKWNFGKFLISREGKLIHRFEPQTKPDAPEVIAAIEAALSAK
jgi:glutathione peroxidase